MRSGGASNREPAGSRSPDWCLFRHGARMMKLSSAASWGYVGEIPLTIVALND
jgi:hypothetical protein